MCSQRQGRSVARPPQAAMWRRSAQALPRPAPQIALRLQPPCVVQALASAMSLRLAAGPRLSALRMASVPRASSVVHRRVSAISPRAAVAARPHAPQMFSAVQRPYAAHPRVNAMPPRSAQVPLQHAHPMGTNPSLHHVPLANAMQPASAPSSVIAITDGVLRCRFRIPRRSSPPHVALQR
jgi:hypothetical protein